MPVTLPSYVAPNELIQSAWGNSVVDAFADVNDDFMPFTGGAFTGAVSWASDPTSLNHLARKGYVDVGDAAKVDLTGDEMTGQLIVDTGASIIPIVVRNGDDVPAIAWRSQADVEYLAIVANSSGVTVRTDGTDPVSILAQTTIHNEGSSSRVLQVKATNDAPELALLDSAGADLATFGYASTVASLSSVGSLAFASSSTERGRLVGTAFLFGKTAADLDVAGVEIYGTGSAALGSIRSTSAAAGIQNLYCQHQSSADADTQLYAEFARTTSGTVIGSIDQNGTTGVRYNTTSDQRLKSDVGLLDDDGLETVARFPIRRYRRLDGREHVGMFAQELAEVVPHAVRPGGDDPNREPWMTAYSDENIIGHLALAVQQLRAEVAALKGEVA